MIRWLFGTRASSESTETEKELGVFQTYQRDYFKLPGWFIKEAAVVWDCLLNFQAQQDFSGNLMEIGVWKGKSASCIAIHAKESESCVFADRLVLPELKETIRSIRGSSNLFIEGLSSELRESQELMQMGSTFRWIHIDGEHSGEAIKHDLALAHDLLGEFGILCLDDVPSAPYPQAFYAVVEYLVHSPELVMIACGHNKCYICRREAGPLYREYIGKQMHEDVTKRGGSVTIWKSGRQGDCNCFGITNRVGDYDYRGPDWNPSLIDY